MATRKTITPWMMEGQPFLDPQNKFGMVYLITCNHPECKKKYIGMKFFYRNWGKKTKQTDSDWRTYRTSSIHVKTAIQLYGSEYFTFEVVQLFDTRAGVVSGEVECLWAAKVLHALDDNGERLYWNNAIGNIKFIAKEHISEETRKRMSVWQVGEKNTSKRPEVRAKMSASGKMKIITDEHKANMSKNSARRGKPSINETISDETILKVFRLLHNKRTQRSIANELGIRQQLVSSIHNLAYPRYRTIYNEFLDELDI